MPAPNSKDLMDIGCFTVNDWKNCFEGCTLNNRNPNNDYYCDGVVYYHHTCWLKSGLHENLGCKMYRPGYRVGIRHVLVIR